MISSETLKRCGLPIFSGFRPDIGASYVAGLGMSQQSSQLTHNRANSMSNELEREIMATLYAVWDIE